MWVLALPPWISYKIMKKHYVSHLLIRENNLPQKCKINLMTELVLFYSKEIFQLKFRELDRVFF